MFLDGSLALQPIDLSAYDSVVVSANIFGMREAVLLTDYQISQVLHAPDLLGLLTHVEYGGSACRGI